MKNELPQPLFILGNGRSGTTLLASLINRFPNAHIAKETGYISRCFALFDKMETPEGIAELVARANSWLAVEGWTNRASVDGFRDFSTAHELSGPAAFVHYVWQLDCRRDWSSLEHIGDNTPGYVWAIPMLDRLLPEAKFIHIVRDPRDVAASMIKMRFGANDAVTAALDWHSNIGAWLMATRNLPPERCLEIRYEDLCAKPEEVLAIVADFAGLPKQHVAGAIADHNHNFKEGAGEFSGVAGKEHHKSLHKPISTAQVSRYRRDLAADEIRCVEEVTQLGMLAYGYEPEKWHLSPVMEDRRFHFAKAFLRDVARRFFRKLG